MEGSAGRILQEAGCSRVAVGKTKGAQTRSARPSLFVVCSVIVRFHPPGVYAKWPGFLVGPSELFTPMGLPPTILGSG